MGPFAFFLLGAAVASVLRILAPTASAPRIFWTTALIVTVVACLT